MRRGCRGGGRNILDLVNGWPVDSYWIYEKKRLTFKKEVKKSACDVKNVSLSLIRTQPPEPIARQIYSIPPQIQKTAL